MFTADRCPRVVVSAGAEKDAHAPRRKAELVSSAARVIKRDGSYVHGELEKYVESSLASRLLAESGACVG